MGRDSGRMGRNQADQTASRQRLQAANRTHCRGHATSQQATARVLITGTTKRSITTCYVTLPTPLKPYMAACKPSSCLNTNAAGGSFRAKALCSHLSILPALFWCCFKTKQKFFLSHIYTFCCIYFLILFFRRFSPFCRRKWEGVIRCLRFAC